MSSRDGLHVVHHLIEREALRGVVKFERERLLAGQHLGDLRHPPVSGEARPHRGRYVYVPPSSVFNCTSSSQQSAVSSQPSAVSSQQSPGCWRKMMIKQVGLGIEQVGLGFFSA